MLYYFLVPSSLILMQSFLFLISSLFHSHTVVSHSTVLSLYCHIILHIDFSPLLFTVFSVPSEKEREGDKVEKDLEQTETRLRKEINMETLKKLIKLILMKDKYNDVRTCTRAFIRVD